MCLKLSIFVVAALLALTAATSPASRADDASPAQTQYLKEFVDAIENNDVATVKTLMKSPDFNPATEGWRHYTLFREALENNAEIAQLMMKSPAWKTAKWESDDARANLETAAYTEQLFPVLRALAAQPAFDASAADDFKHETLLFIAARRDNLPAVKWLVGLPKFRVTRTNKDGENALFGAQPKSLKFLLSLQKFDVNQRAKDGSTALHSAARDASGARVRALLADAKINPNLKDKKGRTALDYAMERDHNWKPNAGIALMESRKVHPTPRQRKEWKRIRFLPAPPYQSPPDSLPFPGTMTGSNDFPDEPAETP